MKELSIPPEALEAKQAVEIFRRWIIDERLFCSLLPLVWKDEPETWGVLLADALQHICDAIQEKTGQDKKTVRAAILQVFNAEIENPTAEHEGEFCN